MHIPAWSRIGEVFHAALELAPAEREAFLARECGGDAGLRAEVASMLAAHEGETRLHLEDRLLQDGEPADPLLGRTIGAYRLLSLLGRGGMGDVYLAERGDDQYERRVAFKLIRSGRGNRAAHERFLRERQILAQFEHPNIAMLLDGGVTDDGRPYLVMQYVDGEPITDWCRRRGASLRRRLELFHTVCGAVQAAHNNLVVHRDLKPANILVTPEGQVRLLDFGIAKLLDEAEPGLTVALDRLLTPEHAAPEQVTGRAVTTATDVYALGVLLYELLADQRPFDVDRSSAAAIERAICETVPPPPSSRAGASGRALRGELDNIVLMALRKEPERRYPSARELGEDVAHHLQGRPVRAQGDALGYRLRKAAVRHRTSVVVAAAFMLTIAWSLGALTAQSRRTAAERDRAVAERIRAESEQARADAVVDVFSGLLAGVDPNSSPEGQSLSRDDFLAMLGDAVDDLDGQPGVQARLLELLASAYRAYGRNGEWLAAMEHLVAHHERSGGEPRKLAALQHGLAMAVRHARGPEAGVPLLRASRDRQRALLGPISQDLAIATQDLAEALAASAQDAATADEALALMNESFAMSRAFGAVDSVGVARAYNGMGNVAWSRGDAVAAFENYRRARDLLQPRLGAAHPYMRTVTYNLALTMRQPDQLAEAETMLRSNLRLHEAMFGKANIGAVITRETLGVNLALQGRLDEALAVVDEAVALRRELTDQPAGGAATAQVFAAVILTADGRADDALPRLDEAAAADPGEPADEHLAAYGACRRALALYETGRVGEAWRALQQAAPMLKAAPPTGRAWMPAEIAIAEATLLLADGRGAEAVRPARLALDLRLSERNATPGALAMDRGLLGAALAQAGQTAEARTLLVENADAAEAYGMATPLQKRLVREAVASASR